MGVREQRKKRFNLGRYPLRFAVSKSAPPAWQSSVLERQWSLHNNGRLGEVGCAVASMAPSGLEGWERHRGGCM